MEKKIKLGVFGARRGSHLGGIANQVGFEMVALCDTFEPLLMSAKKRMNNDKITYYTDFDKMLEHDIDAVIIANYATEHVWAVIKALNAGKHVMSECMAMFTMAEAVQLVEAVEASNKVYMFAENYPFSAPNQEMARLYRDGAIGDFKYGEGEYIHPINPEEMAGLMSGPDHWRSWLPITYYCTHSMGPVMLITGTRPTQVTGFVIPYDDKDAMNFGRAKFNDVSSVLMCRMDNEALVKIIPWSELRDHGNRVRICGNKGTMEASQQDGRLRVHHEPFDFDPPRTNTMHYMPNFPDFARQAFRYGHGGGDFFTNYYFHKAIVENSKPIIDVYMAIDMTAIGILGYRSALAGGIPMEIPDFRDKAVREKYRNDDWNPNPALSREGMPLPSVRGKIELKKESLDKFYELRKKFVDGL